MSSVTDPHPEQPAEELVAYLDGELPPEECRHIEARLAADADYRQQLRDLDQAWEALDALPTRKANDDFARTTMELVTVAAQADASAVTATAAGARRRRMAWFAGAALAGTLLGFLLARLLLSNQNQALLEDLPVIRRYETLRQIENIDFLRRLAAEVPADQLMSDEPAIDHELEQMASIQTRRAWVKGLSPEHKVVLASQAERFGKLQKDQQTQLRTLNDEIRAGGPDLQRMLLAYDQWLSRLTAGQQEDLRQNMLDRPVEDQIDLVRRLVHQESEQASRQLSPKDADTLRENLRAIASEHQAELMASPRWRGDGEPSRRPPALTIVARALFRNDSSRDEIRNRLSKGLSPKAQSQLDALSGWRKDAQLWRWIVDSLPTKVDSHALERFFAEKLDTEQREHFLSLPPNEMQARLERLYYLTEFGDRRVADWWAQFRDSTWPSNRSGDDRPGFRPDGRPRERGRRDGRPEFFDRERMQRRPNGPPPPRDENFRDGRPPFGPPSDGPRPGGPQGPPADGPTPRDREDPPEEI